MLISTILSLKIALFSMPIWVLLCLITILGSVDDFKPFDIFFVSPVLGGVLVFVCCFIINFFHWFYNFIF